MIAPSPSPASLPIELWRHVLQYLVLQPLPLDQALPSEAFCSNRNALRELCLTSRLLLAIARPYLYETVILSINRHSSSRRRARGASLDPLVLLTRTLAQNTSLRPLIRNLALPITLSTGRANSLALAVGASLIWRELRSLFAQLSIAEKEVFVAVGLSPGTADEPTDGKITLSPNHGEALQAPESLVQKLIAVLLAMTSNVDRLLLQDLFVEHTRAFDQAVHDLVDRSTIDATFLPALRMLQVQSAFSTPPEGSHNYWHALTGSRISSPLLNRPLLHRLDTTCSWLSDLSVTRQALKGVTQLKDLNLIVTAGIAPLETFIGAITNLRSLSLDFRTPRPSLPEGSVRESDLNNVLLSRAKTLERFALDTTLCSSQHAADQLGPLEKLISLPSLHRLTHLSVEPHLLIDWLNVNTWPRFLSTLPPNIVWLTLRFVPEHGKDLLRIWARSGVGAALRAPPEKWQSKVPHLRHIHLEPLPFSPRIAETIKEDLDTCGISLTWHELEAATELPFDFASLSIH